MPTKLLMKEDLSVTNDKEFDEEVNRMLDLLVVKGLVEVVSIDAETGEFLYKVSEELIDAFPHIREETQEMFLEQLDTLWIKGFISMDKTLDNPVVSLNPICFDQNEVQKLSFEERVSLYTIMDAMKIRDEE